MLYGIGFTLCMFWLFENTARRQRLRTIETKTRFELFAIRDKLRSQAISGEVEDNWLFDYFDTTLTRLTEDVHRINLWHAIALAVGHAKNDELKQKTRKLQHELQRPANKFYADIFDAYSRTLTLYLLHRHAILIGAVARTARIARGISPWGSHIACAFPTELIRFLMFQIGIVTRKALV